MLVLGLGLLIAGIILKIVDEGKEVYDGHAKAKVVDLVVREENGRYRTRYYPVLEYYAQGMLFKVVYPEGSYPSRWDVGKELDILYEPSDPQEYVIVDKTVRLYLPQILQAAGIALLVIGVISFIRFASRY